MLAAAATAVASREFLRIAADDPGTFCRRHCRVATRPSPHSCRGVRLPPVMPTREEVERVRQFILTYVEPEPKPPVELSRWAKEFLLDCEKVRARLKAATG